MKIPTQLHFATRFLGRTGLKLQQASPTIMTVGGIAALIAAGVLAVKATPDMDLVAEELAKDLNDYDEDLPRMSEDEKLTRKVEVYTRAAIGTVKVYGLPIALAAAGTASILYSHGVMKKRNAALVAAYGILERSFQAYRERVRDSFGEETDDQLYRGHTLRVDNVDHEKKTFTMSPVKPGAPSPISEYAIEFGPQNRNWNPTLPDYNLVFLRAQQKFANDKLNAYGHVLLNDVYDALGAPRTAAGCVVGWVKDGPDGYIDFGLPEAGSPEESDYFYFYDGQGPIYLDFNVDGVVYDKVGKR